MPAATLLADLQRRGLRIRAQGDALIVEPRSALTDELRLLIRANKPQLLQALAQLPADLDRRIRAMARRWQFTHAELGDVLARARLDPVGWMRAVALDERREQEFHQRGLLPSADA